MTTTPTYLSHDWFPRPLPSNVVIGERSWCYSSFSCLHYQSRKGVRIGHDTGIYHGTFFELGADGQVDIGNYCTLVGPIIATNKFVVIGDYTFIAHEVVVADSFAPTPPGALDLHSDPPSISESKPSILIGANCWIGARAILLDGARLGEGAVVGAAAVIDFEVPPGAIVAGNPAKVIGSSNQRSGDGFQYS